MPTASIAAVPIEPAVVAAVPEITERIGGITIASSTELAKAMKAEVPAGFDLRWQKLMTKPKEFQLPRYNGELGDPRVIEWFTTTQKRLQLMQVPVNQWRHIVPALFEGRAEALVGEIERSEMTTYATMQDAIVKKFRVVTDSLADEALRLPWNPAATSMIAYFNTKCQYGAIVYGEMTPQNERRVMSQIVEGLPDDFRVSLAKDDPKTLEELKRRLLGLENAYMLAQKLRTGVRRTYPSLMNTTESADSRNHPTINLSNKLDDTNMPMVIHRAWLEAKNSAPAYCGTTQAKEDYATSYITMHYSITTDELDAIVSRGHLSVAAIRETETMRCRSCGSYDHWANACTNMVASRAEVKEARELSAQSIRQAEETKRACDEKLAKAVKTIEERTQHFDSRLVAAESSPKTALANRNQPAAVTPVANTTGNRASPNGSDTGRNRNRNKRRSGQPAQQTQASGTQYVLVPTPQYAMQPQPQMQAMQQHMPPPQQFAQQQQQSQGSNFQRNRFVLQQGQAYCSRCKSLDHHYSRCVNPMPGGPCGHCLHPGHTTNMCYYAGMQPVEAQRLMSQRNDQSASAQLYVDGSPKSFSRGGNRGRGGYGYQGSQGYQGGRGFQGNRSFGNNGPNGSAFANTNRYNNDYANADALTRRWQSTSNQPSVVRQNQQLNPSQGQAQGANRAPPQIPPSNGPVMMVRETRRNGPMLLKAPRVYKTAPELATAKVCGLASEARKKRPPMLSHCLLPCRIVNHEVVVYLDTGSGVNVMGARIFQMLDPRFYHFEKCRLTNYVAANDTPLVFLGQVTVLLEAVDTNGDTWSCHPTFYVCEGFQGILLGTDFVSTHIQQITWDNDGPRMVTKPKPVQDHITGLGPFAAMTIELEQYVPPHMVAVVTEDVRLPKQSIGHIPFCLGKNIYNGKMKQATSSDMLFEATDDFNLDSGVMLAPALIARNVGGVYFTNAINATTKDRRFKKGEVVGLVRADDLHVTPFRSSDGRHPTSQGQNQDVHGQSSQLTAWYRVLRTTPDGVECSSTERSFTPRRR